MRYFGRNLNIMNEKRKLTISPLTKVELHAPHFLTQKRSIVLFLICVALFASTFVAIYRPLGFMRMSDALSSLHLPFYTIIVVATGFVILLASRILLYQYQKRRQMAFWGYVMWIIMEIVVFTFALSLLADGINMRQDISFPQLMTRIFLDIVGILLIPYIISILIFLLDEKRQEIDALQAMLPSKDQEKTMTGETINFFDRGGRLVFATKKSNVLYIEASDNYTNIHYINEDHEDCFILHNSMKNVEGTYSNLGMLRCHRGYLVNLENIKLIRKEKDGMVIELAQSNKTIPVSKTYVNKVAHSFAGNISE